MEPLVSGRPRACLPSIGPGKQVAVVSWRYVRHSSLICDARARVCCVQAIVGPTA
jgi:hypothetical protein